MYLSLHMAAVQQEMLSVYSLDGSFVKVSVLHSHVLDVVNAIIGWIYFAAWSISFYPQIIENWKRKRFELLSPAFILFTNLLSGVSIE
jgi:PQ loop repeat